MIVIAEEATREEPCDMIGPPAPHVYFPLVVGGDVEVTLQVFAGPLVRVRLLLNDAQKRSLNSMRVAPLFCEQTTMIDAVGSDTQTLSVYVRTDSRLAG